MNNKLVLTSVFVMFLLVVGILFFMRSDIKSVLSSLNTNVKPLSGEPETQNDDIIYMVSHSEYWSGEDGQVITRLLNYQGVPITDANCTVDILYPDRTYFKQNEQMTFDIDSYYYTFITPDIEGVYQYKADCMYANNTKESSITNSFHLSPALNFERVIYDNLSNQIANLTDLENVHFGDVSYNLTQIRNDTQTIINTMQTKVEATEQYNSVVQKLDEIANFCGTNYTSGSLLCQWVNQSVNQIAALNNTITTINQTVTQLINQTNIIINQTTLLIETINSLQQNFTDLRSQIESLNNQTYQNFSDRFDSLSSQLINVSGQINEIENKLDCNNTINVLCDKINNITVIVEDINNTSNFIENYITTTITEYLQNMTFNLGGPMLGSSSSEIDLLIDGFGSDVTRSGGLVQFTVNLINPVNSTGLLELYIDGVLNATGSSPLNVPLFMSQGVYSIEGSFQGDDNYSVTTEYLTLTVTSTNDVPFVVLINPLNGSVIDLPYNITFIITDDNPDNVSLILYSSGVYNETIVSGISGLDGYYYWSTTTSPGYYDLMINVCEIGTPELYCVNDTHSIQLNNSCVPDMTNTSWSDWINISCIFGDVMNQSRNATWYDSDFCGLVMNSTVYEYRQTEYCDFNTTCVENWFAEYDLCQINNTRLKTYVDLNICNTTNSLPGDNGTYVTCDYCSEDITGPFYEPSVCLQNETQLRYYIDDNFGSCCLVTSLFSDCSILYVPYTNETVNCTSLQTGLSLYADDKPYLNDRIYFKADLNEVNFTKCWSYVKKDGNLLQTNPQKAQYTTSLFSSKEEESREYFTPVKGVVNAYYTKQNLLAGEDFVLGLKCALSNGSIIDGEQVVSPQYQDLREVTARSAWGAKEMSMIVITVVIILFLISMMIYAWKK